MPTTPSTPPRRGEATGAAGAVGPHERPSLRGCDCGRERHGRPHACFYSVVSWAVRPRLYDHALLPLLLGGWLRLHDAIRDMIPDRGVGPRAVRAGPWLEAACEPSQIRLVRENLLCVAFVPMVSVLRLGRALYDVLVCALDGSRGHDPART